MKVLSIFTTALLVAASASSQTEAETDSIDTSAFDRYLNEIVIVASQPGTTAKADRKIYSVNHDLMSRAASAGEILNHIPSVEVDIDGNVSMRGDDNVTILINGKPSAMMADKTRAEALAQLSAANIERIEVIDNPPAEYRAEGGGGIINIIMKSGARQGFNGSVVANAGSAGRYNAGVSATYGIRSLNFHGGYTFRRDRYDRTIDDHRISPTDAIDQTTYGLGRPVSHTFRLGMTANITPDDMLSVSGNYNHRNFKRDEYVDSRTIAADGAVSDLYHRDRDADARENMWEGTLQYNHRYGDSNEISIGYIYSSESEDELNRYTTLRHDVESRNNETVWDANYIHDVTMRWQHALADNIKLTAGYEFEHLRAEQNYHVSDWDGASFIPNAGESNDFTHIRMLNSLFVSTDMTFGQWRVNAGLRGECTDADFTPIKHGTIQLNARYHSATLVPQGKRNGDFQLNLGLKYDIPSLDLAIFASVTDLLDTYKLSYTLDTPALKQKVEKRRNPRIIYVGLSWNFGGGSKSQHHDVKYEEEM